MNEDQENNEILESQDSVLENTEVVEESEKSGYINDPEEYARVTGKPIETFKSKDEYDKTGEILAELKKTQEALREWKTATKVIGRQAEDERRDFERRYTELQAQIKDSVMMGDDAESNRLQTEQARLLYAEEERNRQAILAHNNQLLQEFRQRNSDWCNESNPRLVQQAEVLKDELIKTSPNLTPADLLYLVEQKMRAFYVPSKPQVAGTPNLTRTNSGINKSAVGTGSKLSKEKMVDFEAQNEIFKSVGLKQLTVDEYLKYNR